MRTDAITIILLVTFGPAALGAEPQPKPELFRQYYRFSLATPLFVAVIPAKTCQMILAQADRIVGSLSTVESIDDLQIASDNLRICATTDSLKRKERDLAVGLYGEFVFEHERRESKVSDGRRSR